jgi:hypothetical protein
MLPGGTDWREVFHGVMMIADQVPNNELRLSREGSPGAAEFPTNDFISRHFGWSKSTKDHK